MNKIIVANWKMNPQSKKEAEVLFNSISKGIKNIKNSQIIICPPFPFLSVFGNNKSKKIFLGAQNVSIENEGSHTGEVSASMIFSMKGKYAIVGHSECRSSGETNKTVNTKILNLIRNKISPIVCVGEKDRDHDGNYLSFIEDQIRECLNGVSKTQIKNLIIAYEPVWAIGKNATREATKEEFIEMKIFIKKVISDLYDSKIAHSIPILYGGSVNSLNAKSFAIEGGADGLLVGRDSLNPKKFEAILNALK